MTLLSLWEPGMGQVLPLQEQPDAEPLAQPAALGDRGRPPSVVSQQAVETAPECGISPGRGERGLELLAGRHERLGYEPSTELAEAAVRLRVAHQLADGRHPSSCQS